MGGPSRAPHWQGMEAKRDAAEQLSRTHILELETKLLEAALRMRTSVRARARAAMVRWTSSTFHFQGGESNH